jgi:hypothetical protein
VLPIFLRRIQFSNMVDDSGLINDLEEVTGLVTLVSLVFTVVDKDTEAVTTAEQEEADDIEANSWWITYISMLLPFKIL